MQRAEVAAANDPKQMEKRQTQRKVYDGTELKTTLRGTFNMAPVYSFTSTGNSIRIYFHTDESIQMKGFSSYFVVEKESIDPSSIASTPACGQNDLVATESVQHITSPQWPELSTIGILCTWVIAAPVESQVEISFTGIDLSPCCDFIEVKAYRGEDLVGTEKIKYQTDKNFRSPVGGRLEITYNTFGLMPRRGFRANYVAVSENITPTRGLSSTPTAMTESTTEPPLYTIPRGRRRNCGGTAKSVAVGKYYFIQAPFRNQASCNWRFIAPANFLVKLTFFHFNVDPESATFRLVRVRRGRVNWNNAEVLLQLSDDKSGFEYTFDSNMGGITYRASSDDSTFTIMYSAVPASCGSQAIATSFPKQINTPGYPTSYYKGDLNCTWNIASQVAGAPIHFVFTLMEMTPTRDFVQVYDGSDHVSLDLLTENQVYISNTDRLKVVFTSTEHSIPKGFVASFHIEQAGNPTPATTPKLPDRPNRCGKTLRRIEFGRKYIIRTPKRRDTSCRWKLQTDNGLVVKVTFLEFDMGPKDGSLKLVSIPSSRFNWNSLEVVLDESQITAGQSFLYPGHTGGVIYQSDSNALVTIQYEAALPEGKCGFSEFAISKFRRLVTPGYPSVVYRGEMNCTWNIRARVNNRVELVLTNFQLRADDQLQIIDGNNVIFNPSSILDDPITQTSRRFVSSTRNGFTVKFTAGAGDALRGFAGTYRQIQASRAAPTPSTSTTTTTTTATTTAATTTTARILTTTSMAVSSSASTTKTSVIEAGPLRCYQIVSSSVRGSQTLVNSTSIQTCQNGSVCLIARVVATVTIETLPEPLTTEAVYGICVPRIAKETYGCNEIFATAKTSFDQIPDGDVKLLGCGLEYLVVLRLLRFDYLSYFVTEYRIANKDGI